MLLIYKENLSYFECFFNDCPSNALEWWTDIIQPHKKKKMSLHTNSFNLNDYTYTTEKSDITLFGKIFMFIICRLHLSIFENYFLKWGPSLLRRVFQNYRFLIKRIYIFPQISLWKKTVHFTHSFNRLKNIFIFMFFL